MHHIINYLWHFLLADSLRLITNSVPWSDLLYFCTQIHVCYVGDPCSSVNVQFNLTCIILSLFQARLNSVFYNQTVKQEFLHRLASFHVARLALKMARTDISYLNICEYMRTMKNFETPQ